MALKKKLTKEEHEKLSEHLKGEYVADGDGYRLDLDGDEDTGALKRAKDREVQLRKEAEAKLKEMAEQLERQTGDDARKSGDIATLEKSWQGKLDKQREEYEARLNGLTGHVTKNLVDNVALSIATKISTAPEVLLPHIRSRLQADFDGDAPKTRVLDRDGKPSALTVDELAKEFVDNKAFSAIIVGSKASGGAGKAAHQVGGAGKKLTNDNQTSLAKMNPAELAQRIRAAKEQGE